MRVRVRKCLVPVVPLVPPVPLVPLVLLVPVGPPPAGVGNALKHAVICQQSLECSSHGGPLAPRSLGPLATSRCSRIPTLSFFFFKKTFFLVIFCVFHMLVCGCGLVIRRFYLLTFHRLSCFLMNICLFFLLDLLT